MDGIAPDVVRDTNGDGVFDETELQAMGFNVLSDVVQVDFTINGR